MSELLRRYDRLPFRLTLLQGVVLGLAVALGTARLPGAWGWAAAAAVIALAGAVAWTARPVGVWQEVVEEPDEFLDMVAIAGGRFLMGSPWRERGRDSDERRHRVKVSAFRMSTTTITRDHYRQVMGIDKAPGPGGDDHPVTEISWFQAIEFCNRLSERERLPPCYRIEGEEVSWVEDAGGYRLPTEAEWEYAARSGSKGRWPFGDDEGELGTYAWFTKNSGDEAHPVGTLEPNPWGLYDMHGNVWEWCWDAWGSYGFGWAGDPRDPRDSSILRKIYRLVNRSALDRFPASSARRVLRGGSAWLEPWLLRSACRNWLEPEGRLERIGFRCVRRPRRQPRPSTS